KAPFEWVKSTLPGFTHQHLGWMIWRTDGKDVPPDDNSAAKLEALADRAAAAPLPWQRSSLDLPSGWNICSDYREVSAGTRPLARYSLTRPVVVGDVALVEIAEDCDSLCGSGYLVALELHEGRWRPVAQDLQWMA